MRHALLAATAISAILSGAISASAAQFNMGMRPMGPMVRMAPAYGSGPMLMRRSAPMARPGLRIAPRAVPKFVDARKGSLARGANEARRLGNIAVSKPPVKAALDNDPLNRKGAAADTKETERHIGMLRQRFGLGGPGLGALGPGNGTNHGADSKRDPWGVPGLRPDLNSIPGVSASRGGTQSGDTPDPVGDKDVIRNPDGSTSVALIYNDGSVVTVSRWKDDSGRHTATASSVPGEGTETVDSTVRRDGSSETVWTSPNRTDVFWRTGPGGRIMHMGLPRTDPARSMTGEEGGSNPWWCPPSGWGCKGPLKKADVVAGGRRDRPAAEDTTVRGPRIAGDPQDLAINPNPDLHASGVVAPSSARSFDGGRLVNPGPCAVPGGC